VPATTRTNRIHRPPLSAPAHAAQATASRRPSHGPHIPDSHFRKMYTGSSAGCESRALDRSKKRLKESGRSRSGSQ
jgi:hypothetical protein